MAYLPVMLRTLLLRSDPTAALCSSPSCHLMPCHLNPDDAVCYGGQIETPSPHTPLVPSDLRFSCKPAVCQPFNNYHVSQTPEKQVFYKRA